MPDSLADRFRGRIIFPIFNLGGRVIAFGGRSIGNIPNAAKYLNSPETLVYNKSNVLYNLNIAKNLLFSKIYVISLKGIWMLYLLYKQE